MLKKLDDLAISFLNIPINKSLKTLTIPVRVIQLLKLGEPADESVSYRPISLLSSVAKLIDQLVATVWQQQHNIGNTSTRLPYCYSTTQNTWSNLHRFQRQAHCDVSQDTFDYLVLTGH